MRQVAEGAHAVHACHYHFVWATKYRKPLLALAGGAVDARLKELIAAKAAERGWTVRALETMPDHVHLFVTADSVAGPHYIVNQFKGYTSRFLRAEFPTLRSRAPTLWTRSYFVATAGEVSAQVIERYIAAQLTRPPRTPRTGP
jgi:putative transposase